MAGPPPANFVNPSIGIVVFTLGTPLRWLSEDGSQMGWTILVAVPPPVDMRDNQYANWECGFAPLHIS
eukprot:10849967-Lingulodinium_polyedra.AAC.1